MGLKLCVMRKYGQGKDRFKFVCNAKTVDNVKKILQCGAKKTYGGSNNVFYLLAPKIFCLWSVSIRWIMSLLSGSQVA